MTDTLEHLRAIAAYFSAERVAAFAASGTSAHGAAAKALAASELPGTGAKPFSEAQTVAARGFSAASALLERTKARAPLVQAPAALSRRTAAVSDAAALHAGRFGAAEEPRYEAFQYADRAGEAEAASPEALSRAFARDARRYDE